MGRAKQSSTSNSEGSVLTMIDTDNSTQNRIASAIINIVAALLAGDQRFCEKVMKNALKSAEIRLALFEHVSAEGKAREVISSIRFRQFTHRSILSCRRKSLRAFRESRKTESLRRLFLTSSRNCQFRSSLRRPWQHDFPKSLRVIQKNHGIARLRPNSIACRPVNLRSCGRWFQSLSCRQPIWQNP